MVTKAEMSMCLSQFSAAKGDKAALDRVQARADALRRQRAEFSEAAGLGSGGRSACGGGSASGGSASGGSGGSSPQFRTFSRMRLAERGRFVGVLGRDVT